jgi:threonine dehydratase
MSSNLPSVADVEDAARQIAPAAVVTPLVESPALNEKLGLRLLVKAESLQRTGSFKFRGAYNRISRLSAEEKKRGVVAFSSGNHAQAVASAAKMLGAPSWIVMPADAPAIKIANTRGYGATVVTYDRYKEDREAIGRKLAQEHGATLVPPFEDRYIIAGQGTIGLEVAAQTRALGVVADALVANSSGGGLMAGIALAMEKHSPGTALYCAEPAGFDDHARSLRSGKRESNDANARSICDALLSATPGEMTFAINSRLLKGGLVVTDEEAKQAMATAFNYLKLVVEPGGACALAAVLTGRVPGNPKTVVAIASGGNVDPALYREALAA